MVERRPWLKFVTHAVLLIGVLIVAFPVYITFIASTHSAEAIVQTPMPLLPGGSLWQNYVAVLLADADSFFYVCGLKAMEEGVLLALRDVATQAGLPWDGIAAALRREGRLHLETY